MGRKKKWEYQVNKQLTEYLDKVYQIIYPLIKKNGCIDISELDHRNQLEYILALLLNSLILSFENKQDKNFGADIIMLLKLHVLEHNILRSWGKINWISMPNQYVCYNSFQDPFYAEFKIENEKLYLHEAMFGDHNMNDLDSHEWIYTDMEWKYKL